MNNVQQLFTATSSQTFEPKPQVNVSAVRYATMTTRTKFSNIQGHQIYTFYYSLVAC